jgi:hypothetical protein
MCRKDSRNDGKLGMIVHAYNLSTWEAEGEGLKVSGQTGPIYSPISKHMYPVSKQTKKNKK